MGNDKKTGVYLITNKVNSKVYVGSSIDVRQRSWGHKEKLNNGKHHSSHLQRAWDKYGKESFVFEFLEETPPIREKILEREQHYLDLYESYDREKGYNINPKASSRLGAKWSEESKKKLSETMKRLGHAKGENNPMYGVSLSGEKHGMYGKTHSKESRKKISENHADVSGAKNPKAKLDWDKVNFIRESYKNKTHTVKELMGLFFTGQSTIYNIIYNNTWKVEE
jgi:group I intron endonuclease|tara:strand:- start:285 stop:956 length:672 start_codon:yes stop_codon:yes gene_type:complete